MAELAAIKMETSASQDYFVCFVSISVYPMLILQVAVEVPGDVPGLDKDCILRRPHDSRFCHQVLGTNVQYVRRQMAWSPCCQ